MFTSANDVPEYLLAGNQDEVLLMKLILALEGIALLLLVSLEGVSI